MNWKIKIVRIVFLLIFGSTISTYAQEYSYKYQRSLGGVTDTWHKLQIPIQAYANINDDFSDVRILGMMANGDTIEAPYILKELGDTYENQPIEFNLINQVSNQEGYYYTFELVDNQLVNSMEIKFNNLNFDWLVSLEGSQNQNEWFSIIDKSRIVGIKNKSTSYSYTKIEFTGVKYRYLKLKIPASENPQFSKALIHKKLLTKGSYNSPKISSFKVIEHDDLKTTELLLSLNETMPISFLNLIVEDSVDYYRTMKVQYASDSIKGKSGWQYLYKTLFLTTLSSFDMQQGYYFSNRVLKNLRIIIENGDNEPLTFAEIKLHGNPHQLIARFNKPANYYLIYGNKEAYVPNYDITRFEISTPNDSKLLTVGNEIVIRELKESDRQEPIFKNSIWLWSIMIIVIFILGWFAIKMLKE